MLNLRITLSVALMASAAGCGPNYLVEPAYDGKPIYNGISYEFGFVSEANFDLSDVKFCMDRDGQRVEIAPVGYLGAKGTDRHGPGAAGHLSAAPARLPDEVFLSWFDNRGGHEQAISLVGIAPDMNNVQATIWFIFDGTHWRAVPLTKDQIQQRAIQGRGMTPLD